MRSSLDNNGTRQAGAATATPDSLAPTVRAQSSWRFTHGSGVRLVAGKSRADRQHVQPESVEGCGVSFSACANRDVDRRLTGKRRKQLRANQLAKTTLEAIAIHGGVVVARDDDADARMNKRGSEDPDVEVPGPDPLPLSNDGL
jgi:hypothetical protein